MKLKTVKVIHICLYTFRKSKTKSSARRFARMATLLENILEYGLEGAVSLILIALAYRIYKSHCDMRLHRSNGNTSLEIDLEDDDTEVTHHDNHDNL